MQDDGLLLSFDSTMCSSICWAHGARQYPTYATHTDVHSRKSKKRVPRDRLVNVFFS